MKRKKVDILGVKIDKVGFDEAVRRMEEMIEGGGKHYIVTPNPEFVVLAQGDKQFCKILNRADLAVADGVGLLAAAKFLETKTRFQNRAVQAFYLFLSGLKVGWWTLTNQRKFDVLPERVSGIDLVWRLTEVCADKGYTIGFLGGKEGVAQRAAECLKKKFAELKIVGTWDGGGADKILLGETSQISADILLVAFGHPKQEKWMAENLKNLDVKMVVGVGGAFDYLIGRPKRASLAIRRFGLEWIWRLLKEPKRWRRILTAFPYFPLLVFWRKIENDA